MLPVRDMGGWGASECWCVRDTEATLVPALVLADVAMVGGVWRVPEGGSGNCWVLSEAER